MLTWTLLLWCSGRLRLKTSSESCDVMTDIRSADVIISDVTSHSQPQLALLPTAHATSHKYSRFISVDDTRKRQMFLAKQRMLARKEKKKEEEEEDGYIEELKDIANSEGKEHDVISTNT